MCVLITVCEKSIAEVRGKKKKKKRKKEGDKNFYVCEQFGNRLELFQRLKHATLWLEEKWTLQMNMTDRTLV